LRIIRHLIIAVVLVAILLVSACGVKFETGQTPEEAQASAQVTANKINSDWGRLINSSSPRDVGPLLKSYIDSTSYRFLEYGLRLAEKWVEGNEGRGEPIPVSEMRTIIKSWTDNDKPIIKAWEDNIEYARTRMIEDGFYTQETISILDETIEQFNKVYSTVLFPIGDVDEYKNQLIETRGENEIISKRFEIELDRY